MAKVLLGFMGVGKSSVQIKGENLISHIIISLNISFVSFFFVIL